jgi:hypothetical protein
MTNTPEQAASIVSFLQDSSDSAIDYLDRAMPLLQNNLQLLRSDNPDAGMPMLGEAVDGLQWLIDFFEVASLATAETKPALAKALTGYAEALKKTVQMIVEAMTAKDMVLLADVFEYELIAMLNAAQETLMQHFRAAS